MCYEIYHEHMYCAIQILVQAAELFVQYFLFYVVSEHDILLKAIRFVILTTIAGALRYVLPLRVCTVVKSSIMK